MLKRLLSMLGHIAMLALVCAIAAYWGIKLMTPPPTSAPPPLASPPPRDPDPVLAARMFGLVQLAPTAVVSNVQVAGVVAAGRDSSAVLVVDGQPARAYLLGQEVSPGTTLDEVRPDGVTLASAGGRQEVRMPERVAAAALGGSPPPPAYSRSGNTLSATTSTSPGRSAPVSPNPAPPRFTPPPGQQPAPDLGPMIPPGRQGSQ